MYIMFFLKKIIYLKMSWSYDLISMDINIITSDLLKRLRDDEVYRFTFNFSRSKSQEIQDLSQALLTTTSLRELELEGDFKNQVDRSSMVQVLVQFLKKNTSLTTLNLHTMMSGDLEVQDLADALAANRTLRELSLWNNKIGDLGAQALAQALAPNRSLQILDLSYNEIGDRGAQALSQALTPNTFLHILVLGNNRIGDLGAQTVALLLTTNTSVNRLDLSTNNIGDPGAQSLAQALRFNTSIQNVDVSHNHISQDFTRRIVFYRNINRRRYMQEYREKIQRQKIYNTIIL